MDNKQGLESYYNAKYAKKQFPVELAYEKKYDLKITDGQAISGKQILVIGCNSGDDVAYLTEKNVVKGIDIMQDAIEIAKQNGVDAQCWDVEKGLPFPSEQFDIVVCKEVLEHLIDPEFVMHEIHRVLRGNGYTFISVPNHFWYYFRFRILLGKGLIMPWDANGAWHDWDYFHIRFFTFEGFKALIKTAKFVPAKFYFQETVSDVFAPKKLRSLDKIVPKRLCRFFVKTKPNFFSRDFIAKIVKA